jgi:ferrous iron transport protein B
MVVLTGNPNSGKTTVFNALTGMRARVGNYAGVTVERKEGRLKGVPAGLAVAVLDLPGAYSLSPQSPDEQIARDVLLQRVPEVPAPGLVIVVTDASNLERNLYYATQVLELGYPTLIALNMIDVAEDNGHHVDAAALSERLGVPVQPLVASTGQGIPELRTQILACLARPPAATPSRRLCDLPPRLAEETDALATLLRASAAAPRVAPGAQALLLLSDDKAWASHPGPYPGAVRSAVLEARERLATAGIDWRSAAIEARYARAAAIHEAVTVEEPRVGETWSDRLDQVVTHRLAGPLIFLAIMTLMFQSIFTFARPPMTLLQQAVDQAAQLVGRRLPPGDLNSLLADGVIAGVGAVIVFLPQILLLFFFIGLLEDTGYMARAAFLMDRLMSKVGLHGKSFIPLLSSFACAIPGILATRTIESPKDRLVTLLVAPLMGCSARLPVYTLLIAACIPERQVLGLFRLQGLTLLGMYLLGVGMALCMAWLFKRTLLKGEPPLLILELPPYKRPVLKVVLRHMWDRSKVFLQRAGTVILGISILLWFLASYPRLAPGAGAGAGTPAVLEAAAAETTAAGADPAARAGERLRQSFAGRLGHLIEPLLRPLGFDWKMGIGIIASFAAREVFVSTMATVYNVGDFAPSEAGTATLAETMRTQTGPDGTPVYTTLVGVSLMVFYVFALQCVSTVAVVRRETNSWRWPLFQWLYLGALAWLFAFVTYQGGRLLGWG